MKILLLEDDYSVSRFIQKVVRQEISEAEFRAIHYEKDLNLYIAKHPLPEIDVIVLDVMVAYGKLSEKEVEPVEVEKEGHLRAGIRSLKAIRAHEAYRGIPVILHSNVPTADIAQALLDREIGPDSVQVISKGDDHDKLVEALRALLKC